MRRFRKPHRAKKPKPIFKHWFFWLAILFLIITSGLVYWLFFSSFFQVETIIISGHRKISQQEINNQVEKKLAKPCLSFFTQRNLILADIEGIRKGLLETFPLIDTIKIVKTFPDVINISLKERVGEAKICRYNSTDPSGGIGILSGEEEKTESCFVLDDQGIIFEPTQGEEPFVKIRKEDVDDQNWQLGERVIGPELVPKIIKISSGLNRLDIYPREVIVISEDRLNVETSEGWAIYFDPQKDIEWQLSKLKAVLDEYIPKEERKELNYVELRFGNLAPFKKKGE